MPKLRGLPMLGHALVPLRFMPFLPGSSHVPSPLAKDELRLVSRRGFHAAWFCAVAGGVSGAYAQNKLEKSRVTIAVSGKAGALYYLPLTIAEQLGFFKTEGLDVELIDYTGSTRAQQSLSFGGADVVAGAYEQTLHLQGKNLFFQSFVQISRTPQIALGISVKALPNYRDLGDLRGKNIGVSAPGGPTNMVANLMLARAGLRTGDVNVIGVGVGAGAMAALRSGQIDALCNVDPVMTALEQKGDVKIVMDTRTVKGSLQVFGGPMPAACLYAPAEFVQKHPQTTQALTNAVSHALKWLQTAGLSDLNKAVPESYMLGDRALYLASFNNMREAMSVDGLLPDDAPRTALRALASFDPAMRMEKIELAKTFTNEFARRAKEKFGA